MIGKYLYFRFKLIFNIPRLLSLDGRPLQIYDDDTEVPWPSSLNEQWLSPTLPERKGGPQSLTRTMQFVAPVIRIIPQLKRTIKSPTISRRTIETFDEFFVSILHGYPDQLRPDSDGPLEPYLLHAVFPLQSARLLLYRHNLGPDSGLSDRSAAIERCFRAAYDSLRYISRTLSWRSTMHSPSLGESKRTSTQDSTAAAIRFHANNFICLHVWRITLIFILKRRFSEARTCVRLSRTIGDMRQINLASGRYISAFVTRVMDTLSQHPQRSEKEIEKIMETEEMIAWASGDLQADPDRAWIWDTPSATSTGPDDDGSLPQKSHSLPKTALLTDSEKNDWGGWDKVDRQLAELEDLTIKSTGAGEPRRPQGGILTPLSPHSSHSPHSPRSPSEMDMRYIRPLHNPLKRVLMDAGPGEERPPPAARAVGAERISIANII
jgi:hypothetical protein